MKTQKLGLDDFEAVGTSELLKVKGGMTTLLRVGPGGDGGCAEGDPDPFGGTYSMGEVTVTNGPMWGQQMGSWVHQPCQGCYDAVHPRSAISPLGRAGLQGAGGYHNEGCGGMGNANNRHKVWKPFSEQ